MSDDVDARLRRVKFIVCDVDGVLTDGRMWFDGEGRPVRWLHARDAVALTLWHLVGGKSALVSGLGSKAMEAIADCWKCCECHMWIRDKARACREIAERHGLALDEMAFIGDDIIDLRAMQIIGVSVAVADAVPEVKAASHIVLKACGGQGAVREIVQRILSAQGLLDKAVDLYCSRTDHVQ